MSKFITGPLVENKIRLIFSVEDNGDIFVTAETLNNGHLHSATLEAKHLEFDVRNLVSIIDHSIERYNREAS